MPRTQLKPPTHTPGPGAATDADFPEALRLVIAGARVTRRAWRNESLYVYRVDGYLKHRKADGTADALLVSDGDLDATDWYAVRLN